MQKRKPLIEKLFSKNYQLINGTDEIFELDLALWEYEVLSKEELINRSAYLKLVGGEETTHFKTCNLQNLEDVHKNSSFRTKISFWTENILLGMQRTAFFRIVVNSIHN